MIYNLFVGFELVYLAYFLTRVIDALWVKRLVWLLVGLNLGFQLIYLVKTDFHKFNVRAVLLESVILIVPCLVYFREIFLTKRAVNLLREPSFWMVTGILFYTFLKIPVVLFTDYVWHHLSSTLGFELYSGNNFALIVTYTLFIKAMTCRRKVH